jgi:carboxypeptidase D
LAIYLAGGPGQSSLIAATGQGGPCFINEDSKGTRLNPWSWNNKVNVLYIDQPAQTGYSYDTLVNGTLDQLRNEYTPQIFTSIPPFTPNSTHLYGTIPSQSPAGTANSSLQVAYTLYDFTQVWINEYDLSFSVEID